MYKLVDVVADNMKEFYDYLPDKVELLLLMSKRKKKLSHKTLSQGEKRIKDFMDHAADQTIDGKTAFMLYDTYVSSKN